VTLDEARAELGLDAAATPDESRRAYLRGIKTRRPETDPEGFRRLREAFERVLTVSAAPEAPPGERVRHDAGSDPDVLAIQVHFDLESSRPEEAVAALGQAIDRLQDLDSSTARPTVPVWLLRGILSLVAAGRTADVHPLYDRLWHWLSNTGNVEVLNLWNADDSWSILHELENLDPSFPQELRQAAALAALAGDISPAVQEAERYVERDPEEAYAVAILLDELPMLRDLYSSILQGEVPGQRYEESRRRAEQLTARKTIYFVLGVFLLVAVAVFLLQFFG
jgi:hypothetical protein